MVHIRQSRSDDSQEILQIWRNAVDATHDFLSKEDRIAIEEEVVGFLPLAPLWLAVDQQDHPLAFMLLDGSHMEALFVDPAHKGQGIGTALIKHALSLAPMMTVDVNEQNLQALGFYQQLGFIIKSRSERDSQGRTYPILHLESPKGLDLP